MCSAVLLVRGLQGNTMVVRCGSGWTVGDLSDSLHDLFAVSVPLFYLVVEERVLDCDELMGNLGRDRVISMLGRVLGGETLRPSPSLSAFSGAIIRTVWSSKMPLPNTPSVLGLLDGPVGVDPALHIILVRFRMMRWYLAYCFDEEPRIFRMLD